MILILDENLNPLVADELTRIGYPATSFRDLGWLGLPDDIWLPLASRMPDSLILTCDLNIFRRGRQRSRIIDNDVGLVFLTGANETTEAKTTLIVSSCRLLSQVHEDTPRPFAWFLHPDGRLLDNLNGERL